MSSYTISLLLLLAFVAAAARADPPFIHPGVLLSGRQLSYVKAQVAANATPFAESLAKARANTFVNSRASAAMSPSWNGTISCGFFDSADYGCRNASADGESALLQAYLWAVTGEATWAARATGILDFYGDRLKAIASSWGNGALVAAWLADMFARAAELLASTGAPWPAAGAFRAMLQTVLVPAIYDGSCDNGNWELAMIEGLAGIAVFCENRTLWDHALAMWGVRVPAYIYVEEDGPTHRPGPARCGKYSPFWYNQRVFNASVNGVSQETCRDFGHVAYGLASTFNVAETALIQGVDLFSPNLKRLHSALEFHTSLLVAGAANGWPEDPYHRPPLNITRALVCNGTALSLYYPATYQVALAAMQRAGLAAPSAEAYQQEYVWKLGGSDMMGQYMMMYEPLSHGAPAPA